MRYILTKGYLCIALLSTVIFAGCSVENPTGPELTTGKPALLRNLDNSTLSVVVRIAEGAYEFFGQQRSDGTWFVQMNVPADRTYSFVVSWYTNTKQQSVLLLEQRGQFYAGSNSDVQPTSELESFSVGNGFDADCDGISNLSEMENGSDPLTIPSSCSDASTNAHAAALGFALGGQNICLIHADGQIECATIESPAHEPPDDGTLYRKVESGGVHTCAITQAGEIRCWGYNNFNQQDNIPTSSVAFTDISAGEHHTCALDANGQAYCWGFNSNGQTNLPANNQGFISIHAGALGTCAVRTSGIAECWSTNKSYTSALIANNKWTDFVFPIASEDSPACGLTTDGLIDCWSTEISPPKPFNGPYKQIESGSTFFCGLKLNGELDCMVNTDGVEPSTVDSFVQPIITAIEAWPPLVDFEVRSFGPKEQSFCGLGIDNKIYCAGNRVPAYTLPD